MADGELTLKLDDGTLRRLSAAADAAGVPVESYTAELVAGLARSDDDWTADIAAVAEADRNGSWCSVEEAMAHFDAAVEARFATKR
jgi:hypothetical protein